MMMRRASMYRIGMWPRAGGDPAVGFALVLAAVVTVALAAGCARERTSDEVAATEPAPVKATADQEGWESLFDGKTLGKWKPGDFWKPGKVHVEDGAILLEQGRGDMTGITWGGDPAMLPRIDYEIVLEAMRVEGSDFFCGLTFPYKQSCATLIVGGWGGGLVGISSLDGMDASENETTTYMEFENKRWYTIRLRVTENHIQAWIDDKEVVDVEPGEREVDVRIEVEASKPLGIAAWNTKAALKNIRLRRLLDE